MKRITTLIVLSFLFLSTSYSQETEITEVQESPKQKKEKVNINYSGFAIGANAGVARHTAYSVRNEFKEVFDDISTEQGYQKFVNSDYARKVGINGMVILDGSLMAGGDLSYMAITNQTINNLEIDIKSNTAMINIGAILLGTKKEIYYSYFGFGFGQYIMGLTNHSTDSIVYDFAKGIEVGETQDYKSKFNTFEIGVGYKKFVGESLCFGVDIAAYFSTYRKNEWKRDDVEVMYRNAPLFYGGYLKFYVAFGKIKHRISSPSFN